jgi:hypothetical protein
MITVMVRENLHIEIALLVSLMLHVFAFGSWEYRSTLSMLPGFHSLAKLVRVMHVPVNPAPPQVQTITFVDVDEPRAKIPPEKKQEPKQFMETDASQATGEKPKDAKYYSDRSTVAANPNNPTGKQGDTPYLEGKETRTMNTLDVPTQSGATAPVVVQPGSPGPPARAAQPAPPARPQVAQTPPPQPQPKPREQPKDVAPLGVKIVEEEKMAMAPKPATLPDVVTGSDVPVPPPPAEAGGGAPAVVTEPGVPGREIIARKAHLTVAGVSRTGVAAFGVEENPFGAYDKKIIRAVQSRWYALIDHYGIYESAAKVTVDFELFDDGQVKLVRGAKHADDSHNTILSLFCEKAIIESGPFDPFPDNLRALVGKEPRPITFIFNY